jgi:bacteriocin biosynthesis cyclodehydratase domain-containing protein
LGHVHRAELVHYVLLTLQRAGHIGAVNAGDGGDGGDAESLPPAVAALADRLQDVWTNRGGTNVAAIDLPRKEGETLRLVLTDDYLHTELAEHCSSSPETPALLACLGSRQVWIGPGIEADDTACVACLQDRQRLNFAARTLAHADNRSDAKDLEVERLPRLVSRSAFCRLARAAREIADDEAWQAADQPLQALPLDGGGAHDHRVNRLPQCPVCGDPTLTPLGASFIGLPPS